MLEKKDFINRLATKGYTKTDSAIITEDFLTTLEEMLAEGESVRFKGFGKFEVKDYNERESVSPQGKERITIPAYRSVKFRVSEVLKKKLQNEKD